MSADASAAQPARGTLMAGKRGLIMGVANDRSIAWGIAAACAAQGAELAFTYQGEALEKRVRPLAESVGSEPRAALRCRQTSEHRRRLRRGGGGLGQDRLSGPCHRLRRQGSICAAATSTRRAPLSCRRWTSPATPSPPSASARRRMMHDGGSLLTLTYLGAERVMPHYNVMGVAKAALEASVRYLAADLGEPEHPRQRHQRRPDQDAGGQRHRRFPLHPELEPAQRAAAAQCDDRGGRRRRRSICCPTSAPASPARCITSIAATTSSA